MRRFRLLVCAILFALPLRAAAQEGVDWGGLMGGIAHGTAMDEAAQESVSANRRSAPQHAEPASARLTYTPSLERRRANFARFIAKSREQDPESATALEQALGASDLIAQAAPELARSGFHIDNVAHSYAAWWLNAWLASRQRTDTPSMQQLAAVRAQAANAITSIIARADDAAKQEMAEAYLIQSVLIGASLEHAKDDRAQLARIATAVRQGARASGLDLGAMDLSDQGFVPVGTGALVQGTTPPALADPLQTGAVKDTHGGNRALYASAAAALAGLIGGFWLMRARRKGNGDRRG